MTLARNASRISRRAFHGFCACGAASLATGANLWGAEVDPRIFKPCADVDPFLALDAAGNEPDPDMPLPRAPMRRRKSDPLTPTDRAVLDALAESQPAQARVIGRRIGGEDVTARALQGLAQGDAARALQTAQATPGVRPRGPARAAFLSKWDNGEKLRVFFYGKDQTFRNNILDIANKWSPWGEIEFTSATDRRNSDIRVGFRNDGHWSFIGRDNSVQFQTMNLDMAEVPKPGDYNYGVVLHEFGHAIGMIHEHQSPNSGSFFIRSETINYFRNNQGWTDAMIDLNVLDRYEGAELIRFSDFDPLSVMLYAYPASILTNPGLGGSEANVDLSNKDKEYMGLVYGGVSKVPGGSSDTTPTPIVKRKLDIDGDVLDGKLLPASPVQTFELELDGKSQPFLFSEGYTAVQFAIRKGDSKKDFIRDAERSDEIDLVNSQYQLKLGKGKYVIEVRHRSEQGAGEYRVGVAKKNRYPHRVRRR